MTLIGKDLGVQISAILAILASGSSASSLPLRFKGFAFPMSRFPDVPMPDLLVFFQKFLFFLDARFFHLRERYML